MEEKPKTRARGREIKSDLFKRALERRDILDDEAQDAKALGYIPKVLCQLVLPPSKFVGLEYKKDSGEHHLRLHTPEVFGIPYGVYPRAIMIHFASQVVKRKLQGEDSRLIPLGRSLHTFMRDVTGTKTYSGGNFGNIRPFRRHLVSLLASRFFYWFGPEKMDTGLSSFQSMEIATSGSILWPSHGEQSEALFDSNIMLGEAFWKSLHSEKGAVPIDTRAIRALWPNCLAIDTYVWMTYRANSLLRLRKNQMSISWLSLWQQFGEQFTHLRNFRDRFSTTLKRVLTVYPGASIVSYGDGERAGLQFRFARASILSKGHHQVGDRKILEMRSNKPQLNLGPGL